MQGLGEVLFTFADLLCIHPFFRCSFPISANIHRSTYIFRAPLEGSCPLQRTEGCVLRCSSTIQQKRFHHRPDRLWGSAFCYIPFSIRSSSLWGRCCPTSRGSDCPVPVSPSWKASLLQRISFPQNTTPFVLCFCLYDDSSRQFVAYAKKSGRYALPLFYMLYPFSVNSGFTENFLLSR